MEACRGLEFTPVNELDILSGVNALEDKRRCWKVSGWLSRESF